MCRCTQIYADGREAFDRLVYSANGPCKNSGITLARLAALGYTNVRDYREGKAEWVEPGLPVEGETRAARATQALTRSPAPCAPPWRSSGGARCGCACTRSGRASRR